MEGYAQIYKMKYKTIVIGSSTGIGLAITKKLLDRNHKVTGVSRRGLSLDNESYNHQFPSFVNHIIYLSIVLF